ncbi:MAG: transglutaminase domain-containing protein [Actinobacteria bacterium]|nr:transglutaminase domain-containing protein [Actinomycetota bacterium]
MSTSTVEPALANESRTSRNLPAARRTLLTLLAAGLGAFPLKALLRDNTWLFEGWLTMVVVIAPAALLRLRRAPSALDVWPGIVLLVPWLTVLFVPHHAWGGVIPTGRTWSDVSQLMDSLHQTTRDDVAPINSTVAVRLVICALLGLLAALLDLIAVVARRGALAGVPLLVVYTVAGAVPRSPVSWVWFAVAAVGYLVLLSLDAEDEVRTWGRRISRSGPSRPYRAGVISAPRIAVVAVLAAIVLPLLIPGHPRNLIANAFHNGDSSGDAGFGAGTGTRLSPFAALKGQLTRGKPLTLMNVHIDGPAGIQPFYLRSNILGDVTEAGWQLSSHGATEPAAQTSYPTLPDSGSGATVGFRATIDVTRSSSDPPPVFAVPTAVTGLAASTPWSPQDQIFAGGSVHAGDQIVEQVAQPEPSVSELAGAQSVGGSAFKQWLALPSEPGNVVKLVKEIVSNAPTPYAKARAISNWFADPANGFTYSLKTTSGDSGSDLQDFLTNRVGYCQQYAAAMGIMLRMAGVPSRVVLGYMHSAPDTKGDFTITTNDAHAWVEAYFAGVGWVPFDPTPTAGLAGGEKTDLAWAPHDYSSGSATNTDSKAPRHGSSSRSAAAGPSISASSTPTLPTAAPASGGSDDGLWALLVVAVVFALALVPAAVRDGRRRRRLLAARHGDTEALWAELSDTATDLGYVWSPARTPRQVATWLGRDLTDARPALDALTAAVEHGRYAPDESDGTGSSDLTHGLRAIAGELRSQRSGRLRLQSRLWPASLGWGRGARRRNH